MEGAGIGAFSERLSGTSGRALSARRGRQISHFPFADSSKFVLASSEKSLCAALHSQEWFQRQTGTARHSLHAAGSGMESCGENAGGGVVGEAFFSWAI